MKITRSEDAALGRILYDLEPQEYDGVPSVARLWIDGRTLWSFGDHACIAEALLLHSYVSGPLTFSAGCMPFTADALRSFFAPRSVPITTLTLTPREPPSGGQTITIGRARQEQEGFSVDLAPDAQFRTLFGMQRVSFASNLRTLLRPGEPDSGLTLALCILFAGNLNLRRIVVDREDLPMYRPSALAALQTALQRVNIDLDVRMPVCETRLS